MPNTYDDAAKIVGVLAEMHKKFTIRAGGHDSECGSTTDDILINLRKLNKVTPNIEEETITIQAGTIWT